METPFGTELTGSENLDAEVEADAKSAVMVGDRILPLSLPLMESGSGNPAFTADRTYRKQGYGRE